MSKHNVEDILCYRNGEENLSGGSTRSRTTKHNN